MSTGNLGLHSLRSRHKTTESAPSTLRKAASTPIPAGFGKTSGRYRLNRGGDRHANAAPYRTVLTRMSSHDETRAYVTRRRAEGMGTAEIMRCLKRYVARQAFKHLPRAA